MIREGADGVVSRGKAERGDKTMCDVWLPVADSLRHASENHLSMTAALEAACEVAEQAAQSTITMQARKGRASYPGTQYWSSGSGRHISAVYGANAGCCG